jgi:hypothetical protein
MRGCARVALVLVAVAASFGLAGCGSIDDLKDTISRPFDIGKFSGGRRGVFADDATPLISSEKMPKQEASKASKKKDTSAAAADRYASKETTDLRLHRCRKAARHRGAIPAVSA